MATGILVCGLNGVGKSTLGKALADALSFHFIDSEDLYFPKSDSRCIYASPRSRDEVEWLLMEKVEAHNRFVFAAVRGDYGTEILSHYKYIVLIDASRDLRLQRIRNRSLQKFGDRILPGGDLYEREHAFFEMAASRPQRYVEDWVQTLHCPVVRVDGERPIDENVAFILIHLSETLLRA